MNVTYRCARKAEPPMAGGTGSIVFDRRPRAPASEATRQGSSATLGFVACSTRVMSEPVPDPHIPITEAAVLDAGARRLFKET